MLSTLEQALYPLKPGEPIVYSYFNSTKGLIQKRGIFVRKVNHSKKRWKFTYRKQLAVVKFNGNPNETRVIYNQLKRLPPNTNHNNIIRR